MSLTKTNLAEIVKKQYFHKLRANIDAFSALVGIQVLAILFSLGGVGSSGMSGSGLEVNSKYYSSDVVLIFTMIWAFVSAITINTRQNRLQDFTFVTNRVSSSVSNLLFLATAGFLGSITAILAGNLFQVIFFFIKNQPIYSVRSGLAEAMTGIGITFLYVLLVSSIGYFISSVTSISKIFVFIIPVLIFGIMAAGEIILPAGFLNDVIKFYAGEKSVVLFALKALSTAGLFYTAGIAVLQRMEVRR
ncbi:hypothetical protein [Bacillus sp. FJAT-27445]|uniref:hypothetical protein n=1 Tax=Bacillus sp. FJAT-27445 TaxID=1679166 RepID=UPI0012E3E7B7|nr:hypothetical protein [Bacillus sp. FJAT-27445]